VASLVSLLGVCSTQLKKENNLFKEMAKVIKTAGCAIGTLVLLQRRKALTQTDTISAVPGTAVPPV